MYNAQPLTQITKQDRTAVIRALRRGATYVGNNTALDVQDPLGQNGQEPGGATVIQIPTISLFDITQSYTAYILAAVFTIIFVAFVVFIVYDLSLNHTTYTSSSAHGILARANNHDHLVSDSSGLKKSNSQRIHNRLMVKVLRAEEIWDQYAHLKDSTDNLLGQLGPAPLFYNVYELNDAITHSTGESTLCDPIFASMELTCCCFAETLDKMICRGDGPVKFVTGPSPHMEPKIFQVSCDLFRTEKRLYDQEDKKKLSIYLGISADYINQTVPKYANGFTADNHNECVVKMNFMCVTIPEPPT